MVAIDERNIFVVTTNFYEEAFLLILQKLYESFLHPTYKLCHKLDSCDHSATKSKLNIIRWIPDRK